LFFVDYVLVTEIKCGSWEGSSHSSILSGLIQWWWWHYFS